VATKHHVLLEMTPLVGWRILGAVPLYGLLRSLRGVRIFLGGVRENYNVFSPFNKLLLRDMNRIAHGSTQIRLLHPLHQGEALESMRWPDVEWTKALTTSELGPTRVRVASNCLDCLDFRTHTTSL
jgi:hypothetical protein